MISNNVKIEQSLILVNNPFLEFTRNWYVEHKWNKYVIKEIVPYSSRHIGIATYKNDAILLQHGMKIIENFLSKNSTEKEVSAIRGILKHSTMKQGWVLSSNSIAFTDFRGRQVFKGDTSLTVEELNFIYELSKILPNLY